MTSEDLEIYSPRELQWRYEAETGREDRQFRRIAQHACWVLNMFIGKDGDPLTVTTLLKPKKAKDWWDED